MTVTEGRPATKTLPSGGRGGSPADVSGGKCFMRSRAWWLAAAVGWVCVSGTAPAAEPGRSRPGFFQGDGGSSSREAREAAIRSLPLERFAEADRRDVERVLRQPTLFRRLPAESFTCDRELLEFALSKPEVVVDVWRVLGISRLSLDPTGARSWRMSDGWGTEGTLRMVHHERTAEGGTVVLLGKGGYTGPLAPQPLTGSCVVLLRHERSAAPDRHTMQVDAFLDADGIGLEVVTRTLQPLICRSSATNLHEICLFMSSLSSSAAENPEGVARLAGRLSKVDPADRKTLADMARRLGRQGGPADPIATEKLPAKLASRWLPARQLEGESLR